MDQKAPPSFSYATAGGFVFEVFVAVAIPTVMSAFAGRWLDERFETKFIFTTLGLFLALFLSTMLVVRLAQRYKSRT